MTLSILSPRQIRAARALLNWTQGRLGQEAGVSTAAIARIKPGIADMHMSTLGAILEVLEARGIAFIGDDDGSMGVVLQPGWEKAGPGATRTDIRFVGDS